MARCVLAVFLVLAVLQIAVSGAVGCAEICADERPGDPCAAVCIDCACCAHGARVQGADVGVRVPHPPSTRTRVSDEPATALVRAPADVFHVPKLCIA